MKTGVSFTLIRIHGDKFQKMTNKKVTALKKYRVL